MENVVFRHRLERGEEAPSMWMWGKPDSGRGPPASPQQSCCCCPGPPLPPPPPACLLRAPCKGLCLSAAVPLKHPSFPLFCPICLLLFPPLCLRPDRMCRLPQSSRPSPVWPVQVLFSQPGPFLAALLPLLFTCQLLLPLQLAASLALQPPILNSLNSLHWAFCLWVPPARNLGMH